LKRHLESLAGVNIHSVLVVRRKRLVYEQYFAGEDQCWGKPLGSIEFRRDTKCDIRSITRNLTPLLVGIAIDRNLIRGVDALVFARTLDF
jgi:hypothetical protein